MIIQAILKINPNAKVLVEDTGNINTSLIKWLEDTTQGYYVSIFLETCSRWSIPGRSQRSP